MNKEEMNMQIWIVIHSRRSAPVSAFFSYDKAWQCYRSLQADKQAVGAYGLISLEIEDAAQQIKVLDEATAYKWARQALKPLEISTVEAHRYQQVADKVAAAIREVYKLGERFKQADKGDQQAL